MGDVILGRHVANNSVEIPVKLSGWETLDVRITVKELVERYLKDQGLKAVPVSRNEKIVGNQVSVVGRIEKIDNEYNYAYVKVGRSGNWVVLLDDIDVVPE